MVQLTINQQKEINGGAYTVKTYNRRNGQLVDVHKFSNKRDAIRYARHRSGR